MSTKSVELTHLLAVGSAGAGRPAGALCVSTARHDDDDGRTSINEEEMSGSDDHTHTHTHTHKREEKTNERGARETKRKKAVQNGRDKTEGRVQGENWSVAVL
jgi:hypothetical protein